MDAFLKEILEPSEQDAFDCLMRMETPSINTFRAECVQHLANVGLPRCLIQCRRSWPAYTTHTAPVVKMLVEQDKQRKAASSLPSDTKPDSDPQESGFVGVTQVPSELSRGGSSTPDAEEDSVGTSTADSSLAPPRLCRRVTFAGKLPLCAPPCSSLARTSKKK